jgi:hypothetical protein
MQILALDITQKFSREHFLEARYCEESSTTPAILLFFVMLKSVRQFE